MNFAHAVVASGATLAADRRCSFPLFVGIWICDSLSRLATHWAVGAYAQRVAGRPAVGTRSPLAQAETQCHCVMECVLVWHLCDPCHPGCLHHRRCFGGRQRDNNIDGRASSWALSRDSVSRNFHQSLGIFFSANGPHRVYPHALGPSRHIRSRESRTADLAR
jgi:hypothetical protein